VTDCPTVPFGIARWQCEFSEIVFRKYEELEREFVELPAPSTGVEVRVAEWNVFCSAPALRG